MAVNQFPAPARRADAARNRDKILAAARTAFADPDAEMSMAEIARRAGVGMATLYRNFPGRQELLEALYTDEVNAICQAAESVDGQTPGAALTAWLHRFFAFTTSKRHIAAEMLKQTDRSDPLFKNNRTRVMAAGRPLLAAAQHTHEVRDDLTLEQILDMIVAIAAIHGGTGYTGPILQAALDGLRPGPVRSPIGARQRAEELPVAEFAFPGPLRDQLVAAILDGTKTTTTGLADEYEREGEPLPVAGQYQAVIDSAGRRVAVIETTAVRVIRLGDVDLAHALGEGEGYASVAEWRAGHERFWHSAELREERGDPDFTVGDDTLVVAETFRLVERCGEA
jgi:uncharacterized protein YhfF